MRWLPAAPASWVVTCARGLKARAIKLPVSTRPRSRRPCPLAPGGWGQAGSAAPLISLFTWARILSTWMRARAGVKVYEDLALDYEVCAYIADNPPNQCFVAMSSCATDFPDDCYGWIKLTLEKFCDRLHQQKVPVVILRPYSGYGHDQKLSYPFPAILGRASSAKTLSPYGAVRRSATGSILMT